MIPPIPYTTKFQDKESGAITQPWLQWLELLRRQINDESTLVVSHDELADVTNNQHHNKEHAHDGLDGSGLVNFDSLTNPQAIDHEHSGTPTQQLVQANTHEDADTDTSVASLHHTLGSGNNQAAPGSHIHIPRIQLSFRPQSYFLNGHVTSGCLVATTTTAYDAFNVDSVLLGGLTGISDGTGMWTGHSSTTTSATALGALLIHTAQNFLRNPFIQIRFRTEAVNTDSRYWVGVTNSGSGTATVDGFPTVFDDWAGIYYDAGGAGTAWKFILRTGGTTNFSVDLSTLIASSTAYILQLQFVRVGTTPAYDIHFKLIAETYSGTTITTYTQESQVFTAQTGYNPGTDDIRAGYRISKRATGGAVTLSLRWQHIYSEIFREVNLALVDPYDYLTLKIQ